MAECICDNCGVLGDCDHGVFEKENCDRKLLIFDLDDTLVVTHPIFVQLTERFLQRMRKLGLWDEELYPTMDAIDRGIIDAAGEYVPWAFPTSLRRTYEIYCEKYGRVFDGAEAEAMYELGGSFAGAYHPLVPGAYELLTAAKEAGYKMVLLTQGGRNEQLFKVEQHGFGQYFTEVVVIGKKTPEVYRSLIERYCVRPEDTTVIGNSLKSEVAPALAVGAAAIHMLVESSWAYEDVEVEGEYRQARTLAEAAEILGLKI